jgi:hypothetical protein
MAQNHALENMDVEFDEERGAAEAKMGEKKIARETRESVRRAREIKRAQV